LSSSIRAFSEHKAPPIAADYPASQAALDPVCGAKEQHRFVSCATQTDRDRLHSGRPPTRFCELDRAVNARTQRHQPGIRRRFRYQSDEKQVRLSSILVWTRAKKCPAQSASGEFWIEAAC